MEIDLKKLTEYLCRGSFQFSDAFQYSIKPYSQSSKVYTNERVSGLVFPIRGKARFRFSNASYILERGKILHAGPGMTLSKEVLGDAPWEYILLHYDLPEGERQQLLLANQHFSIDVRDDGCLYELLRLICSCYLTPGGLQPLQLKVCFYRIFEEIIYAAQKYYSTMEGDPVQYILEYLQHHYMEPVSIDELGKSFGLDGRKLAYLFKKNVGISPLSYLTEYRLDKAKELLLLKSMSITEVAHCIGYSDALYFSRLFKKHLGMAPTDFQEKYGKSPW